VFFYSVWIVHSNSAAAFYLVQFRAWELLIGSLLALNAFPKLAHRWQAELIGISGIVLIAASVTLISRNTPFPGLAALAPCLGAAAVIHSGAAATTLTSRALSFLPIRFIGLISYSLYLWHWPLIVFYRFFVNEPTKGEKSALIVICILAATTSWRFIEKPFREKPYLPNAKATVLVGGAAMVFTSLAALALSPLIETVYKYPSRVSDVLSYAKIDESYMRAGTCFLVSSGDEFHYRSDCLGFKPRQLNFLILGDSHAAQLWSGLQASYPAVHFLQATAAGCEPIIGERSRSAVCTAMMKYILETFLPDHHLDGIIIAARWKSDKVIEGITKTAITARSYADRVIIFGPIVEYDQALPRILARAIALNVSEEKFAELHRSSVPGEIDRTFSTALNGRGIQYVSIYRTLCTPACEIWATKKAPLQFDNSHLTCEGSLELARRVGFQLFPDIRPIAKPDGDVNCNPLPGRRT
jgi:hypothetical protein